MKQKNIPVLFITFARPEYARQTFDAIKKAKPSKLYFYSNKARPDNPDEIAKNDQIRAYKAEIDWECDLLTFFRDEHVDVYTSLWSAIDWVFDKEEQAIILEEDCVPSIAFFDFCEQLLPKYKDDWRIWVISGDNYFDNYNPNGYDYIFTRTAMYIYGWASWKTRWQKIERNNMPFEEMKKYDLMRQLYPTKAQANHFVKKLQKVDAFLKTKPAWDYTFGYTIRAEGGFAIIPIKNLVKNIGVSGAHQNKLNKVFHNKKIAEVTKYNISKHPPFVVPDYKYDQYFFYHAKQKPNFVYNKILRKINFCFKQFCKQLFGIKNKKS